MLPKVLVVNRTSLVNPREVSRSVIDRILEAFEFLVDQGQITLSLKVESEISRDDLSGCDIVVFCRHNTPNVIRVAHEAKAFGKKIIYDVDDLITRYPKYSSTGFTDEKLNIVRSILELADVVTVGTERLKANLVNDVPIISGKTAVVPSSFWIDRYKPSQVESSSAELRAVFTNADSLKFSDFKKSFFGSIQKVFGGSSNTILEVFSDKPEEMPSGLPHRFMGTLPVIEHRNFCLARSYAFGITPLGSFEEQETLVYNSCKFPIKFLLYGGLGVPAIYSDNPLYGDVINDGETGLLTSNSLEGWVDSMERLIGDGALRRKIANTAKQEVRERFNPKLVGAIWTKLMREVI